MEVFFDFETVFNCINLLNLCRWSICIRLCLGVVQVEVGTSINILYCYTSWPVLCIRLKWWLASTAEFERSTGSMVIIRVNVQFIVLTLPPYFEILKLLFKLIDVGYRLHVPVPFVWEEITVDVLLIRNLIRATHCHRIVDASELVAWIINWLTHFLDELLSDQRSRRWVLGRAFAFSVDSFVVPFPTIPFIGCPICNEVFDLNS